MRKENIKQLQTEIKQLKNREENYLKTIGEMTSEVKRLRFKLSHIVSIVHEEE